MFANITIYRDAQNDAVNTVVKRLYVITIATGIVTSALGT